MLRDLDETLHREGNHQDREGSTDGDRDAGIIDKVDQIGKVDACGHTEGHPKDHQNQGHHQSDNTYDIHRANPYSSKNSD